MIWQVFYKEVRNLLSMRVTPKYFGVISSAVDCERVRQALTDLTLWSHDNNIQFNSSKCKVMSRSVKQLDYELEISIILV